MSNPNPIRIEKNSNDIIVIYGKYGNLGIHLFEEKTIPDVLNSNTLVVEIDKLKKELDQANYLNRELNKVVDDIRKALP